MANSENDKILVLNVIRQWGIDDKTKEIKSAGQKRMPMEIDDKDLTIEIPVVDEAVKEKKTTTKSTKKSTTTTKKTDKQDKARGE